MSFFQKIWRKSYLRLVSIYDDAMLSALFRRKEPDLRQKCREWFLSSKDRLLTYARLHADSKTDVELLLSSVTQEVVKKIISGEREFDDIEPYTLKALRNKAATLCSRNKHREDIEKKYCEEEALHRQISSNDGLSKLEDKHIIARNELRNLPEDIATIVTLRYWGDFTFAQIADKISLPETSVRRKYEKGIQQLKNKLNDL